MRKTRKQKRDLGDMLLQSVREMKAGRRGRVHRVEVPDAIAARLKSGLSQAQFAVLLGVSVRTLQEWEQGRRQPTGAAKTLLAIAVKQPDLLRSLAA